jgi:hypothetical protein
VRISHLTIAVLCVALLVSLTGGPVAGFHGQDEVRPLPPPSPVRLACGGEHPFTDVAPSSYANDDIACLLSIEVITGTSATMFDPKSPTTREQAAAIAWRFWSGPLGGLCPSGPAPFDDISTSFAAYHITCMWQHGFTTGTTATTFDPDELVTREQLAAFIARIWRTLLYQTCCDPIEATHVVCPAGPMPFADVPSTSFAVDDIACIYNLGVTTGTSPTTFDPYSHATREQVAAMFARLYRQTPTDVYAPI